MHHFKCDHNKEMLSFFVQTKVAIKEHASFSDKVGRRRPQETKTWIVLKIKGLLLFTVTKMAQCPLTRSLVVCWNNFENKTSFNALILFHKNNQYIVPVIVAFRYFVSQWCTFFSHSYYNFFVSFFSRTWKTTCKVIGTENETWFCAHAEINVGRLLEKFSRGRAAPQESGEE